MSAAEQKVIIHPFTDSGLGKAPFRFIGVWSYPDKALLETYPESYNLAMRDKPDCVHGTCDHCGMPLVHFFMIQNADGKRYSVGSSCIHKAGDGKLVTAAKAAERERQRKSRRAKTEAKWAEQRSKAAIQHAIECAANGGVSNCERDEANGLHAEWIEREAHKSQFPEAYALADALEDYQGGFRDSVARDMRKGNFPECGCRCYSIVLDILAKQEGCRNSKAYNAEYERLETILADVCN